MKRHRRLLRRRYGRTHDSRVESVASLKKRGYDYWKRQPTLDSGHTDNLVYDDGRARVWVTRMTVADYDGDRRAWMAERLTVEHLVNGVWKRA
jgi:hypothetical protein